ncbi:hypothetical protein BJV77DRAFT_1111361 [Russula vinacea]|nr:hypothetical protein BJV77DRAFT_1111361 [Russula vinacea]
MTSRLDSSGALQVHPPGRVLMPGDVTLLFLPSFRQSAGLDSVIFWVNPLSEALMEEALGGIMCRCRCQRQQENDDDPVVSCVPLSACSSRHGAASGRLLLLAFSCSRRASGHVPLRVTGSGVGAVKANIMTVVFRLPQTAGEKSVPLPAAIPPKIPASTHIRTVTVQITNPALSWAWPGGHLTRNGPLSHFIAFTGMRYLACRLHILRAGAKTRERLGGEEKASLCQSEGPSESSRTSRQ